MPAKRIFYIDALKAFAIVLVVMGHTHELWEVEGRESFYLPILSIFHMPLFMALSGYVTNVEKFQLGKRAKMLIPFFVFGFAWTAYNQLPFLGFFEHEAKYGYWFLYVLFMFFAFLALIRATKRNFYVGMGIVQICLMVLHFMLHRTIPGTTLSTDHMFQLWPFFCLGILLRRGMLDKIFDRKAVSTVICFCGIVIIGGGKLYFHLTSTLAGYCNDLMSFFIVPLLFLIFHELESRLKGKKCRFKPMVKYLGQQLGVNTLQIYVLQYFIIRWFMMFIVDYLQVSIVEYELILSPIVGVLLSVICVWISQLLHKVKLGFVFGR